MFKDLKEYQEITQLYHDSVNISEEQRAINIAIAEAEFTAEEIQYLDENFDEIITLVSKDILEENQELSEETIAEEDAAQMMKRISQGSVDMNDMLKQIGQLKKMGGLGGIMSMLPGIGKLQKQMAANNFNDKAISKQEAIIYSMTKKERVNVSLLNASRRKRIASGSGTAVSDVNRLVKQQQDMARMMKKMGKMGGLGGLKNMMSSLGGASQNPGLGDGQNSVMDANKIAELQTSSDIDFNP